MCRCHIGHCMYVDPLSHSCGNCVVVWCQFVFCFTEYFPVWHLWKLMSNWRGVSPAYSRLTKAMSVRRNLWTLRSSLFKMSPNSVTFYTSIIRFVGKTAWPVCFGFISLIWGNLQRPWPSSVPAPTVCSFLLIYHFLPPVRLSLKALGLFERVDHIHNFVWVLFWDFEFTEMLIVDPKDKK